MKKLVIILSEKAPDTKHICFEGGCPFYQANRQKSQFVEHCGKILRHTWPIH